MADTYTAFTYGRTSETTAGGLGAVLADVAVLVALQATMAGVGAGDNSTNVTTMSTNLTTLSTDIKKATAGSPGAAVIVNVDTTLISTVSQLRSAFNSILAQAAGRMNP